MDASRLRIGDSRIGVELVDGGHGFCLFGSFLAKIRKRVRVIPHHLGDGIPLRLLSGGDAEFLAHRLDARFDMSVHSSVGLGRSARAFLWCGGRGCLRRSLLRQDLPVPRELRADAWLRLPEVAGKELVRTKVPSSVATATTRTAGCVSRNMI